MRAWNIKVSDLVDAMALLGQTLTSSSGQKGKLLVDTQGGKTFLKRGFRKVGDRVYCPLEVSSIVKSLLYFQPSGDAAQDRSRHLSALGSAWRETFFHPPEVQQVLRPLVKACVARLGGEAQAKFVVPSDEQLCAAWESGSFKVWEV